MAVFSEPTAAVERALLIQQKINRFNVENPDREEMHVRIGIHLGQVAIEDRLATDIFGRHVNRASRIEGLADGGQIYMSYPVFDSAKGWLADQQKLDWKNHGRYLLKGILELSPSEGGETLVSLTPIDPGRHVLHFDAGAVVRYYAEVDVERGENVLRPQYEYFELPGVKFSQSLDGDELRIREFSKKIDYFTYVGGARVDHELLVDVELTSRALDDAAETVEHTIRWDATLDGDEIGSGQIGEALEVAAGETVWPDPETFWEDGFHFFWIRPYFGGDTVQFELGSHFIEYR